MEPFTSVTDAVLSIPENDIDTDIIFPARFLLITEKKGLGRYAFRDRRGMPGFPLAPDADSAPAILVAGSNFGCGSSREQAPWALAGLGIRVVLAESFGEIFQGNCGRNGIVAIRLSPADLERVTISGTVEVDLTARAIHLADGSTIGFDIDPVEAEALLNGWDETARIRAQSGDAIARFEIRQRADQPWLWTV